MTKLVAVAQLWISVVRSHVVHYALALGETCDMPGVTIRIRYGKWLHYYTIGKESRT